MAYKFDAVSFNADLGATHTLVSIGFDLVDDSIIDPVTNKPTILGSTTVSCKVRADATVNDAKLHIAEACIGALQPWYSTWASKKVRVTDWLSSNEAALETYVNSHITF